MKYEIGDKVKYLGDVYIINGGMHHEITTLDDNGEKHSTETLYDLKPYTTKTTDDWDWEYDIPEDDIEPYTSDEDIDDVQDDDEIYLESKDGKYYLGIKHTSCGLGVYGNLPKDIEEKIYKIV